ncbi:MAG: hypothetical protein IJI58_00335 [Bacilli bacterium]|nr:hypothetical protein [Bacilli bacterium]
MEEKKKSSVGLIVLVVILLLACAGMGAFIFINKDKLTVKENTTTVAKNESNPSEQTTSDTKVGDLINNGERIGTYSIYMGKNSMGEYTLTLFSTNDKNNGFFSLVEATSMSYNQVASGYYSIKDSNIEFYQNMQGDSEKNMFVNAFSMKLSDLYQDSQALSEGYSIQYRLKLNYESGKISNSKISFEKLY